MTIDTKNLRERVRNAELRGPQYRPWVSAEELTELLDALERKDKVIRAAILAFSYIKDECLTTDELPDYAARQMLAPAKELTQ